MPFLRPFLRSLVWTVSSPKVELYNAPASSDLDATQAFKDIIPDDFNPSNLEKRFICGDDNRKLYSSEEFPWRAIGKLVWSTGASCSATLAEPATLLTAQHCMGRDGAVGAFYPGYDKEDGGDPFGSAKVVRGVTPVFRDDEGCTASGDWAIYTLNKKPGDKVGALGYPTSPIDLAGKKVMEHLGYPGNRRRDRPYRHKGTKFWQWKTMKNETCDEWSPYGTDTDAMGGQFCGPVFCMMDGTSIV